jgi:hypothetical protein
VGFKQGKIPSAGFTKGKISVDICGKNCGSFNVSM